MCVCSTHELHWWQLILTFFSFDYHLDTFKIIQEKKTKLYQTIFERHEHTVTLTLTSRLDQKQKKTFSCSVLNFARNDPRDASTAKSKRSVLILMVFHRATGVVEMGRNLNSNQQHKSSVQYAAQHRTSVQSSSFMQPKLKYAFILFFLAYTSSHYPFFFRWIFQRFGYVTHININIYIRFYINHYSASQITERVLLGVCSSCA